MSSAVSVRGAKFVALCVAATNTCIGNGCSQTCCQRPVSVRGAKCVALCVASPSQCNEVIVRGQILMKVQKKKVR